MTLASGTRLGVTTMNVIIESSGYLVISDGRC